MGISLQFPIGRVIDGGVFASNLTTQQAIRTNLIFLLTTKRGNRVMRENLYSPLFDYLMENIDGGVTDMLVSDLKDKLSEYMGQITVSTINTSMDDATNTLSVQLFYSINNLGVKDSVTLIFPSPEI